MAVPLRSSAFFPVHDGRRIIVAGGARGIGAATARRLHAEGAAVAVMDIATDDGAALVHDLGPGAVFVPGDIADLASLELVARDCADAMGGIDGIVVGAGSVLIRPAVEHTPADWTSQLSMHLTGAYELVRHTMPLLREAPEGGRVVFISSESGKRGHIEMLAYNAAKAAVINITRVLAEEWAPFGINVNCVCPGSVDTAMLRDVARHYAGERTEDELLASMISPQLGRHVDSDEVARAISMLLSPASDAIRGQALNVDGGSSPY